MSFQFNNGRFQALTDDGLLLVGGSLATYESGTTTPKATYVDASLATPNTNPVSLDARGEAQVWLGSGAYTLVLKDALGVTVWTVDGIENPSSASAMTYVPSGANAITRTVQDWLREEVHLLDYGTTGSPPRADGVVDCTAAFRAAYAELVNRINARATSRAGGRLVLPSGSIRITDEIDMYRANSPRIDIEIVGQGELSTQILVDFYGAGKSVFKSVDPLGVSRASPIHFKGLRIDNVATTGGVNPVFINVLGWGESTVQDVRLGPSNNTQLRGVSMQNCRFWNVNLYGGGRSFNYKRTSGMTFSVNTGTKTITASGAIFTAADIGKFFFVFPTDPSRRIRYTIATVPDSTHATYSDTNGLAETSMPGWFEPARCSITTGTTALTADSSCFTADMVGLVLYIRGATAGSWGAKLLRAKISAYVSPTQVTLDTAATNTVTNQFFGIAAMDCGLQTGYDGSSDVKAFALRVEHYLGLGLVAQNTDAWDLIGCKLHGQPTADDDNLSLAAAWLDDFGGVYQGELDSTCSMADYRIFWCNANDTTQFGLTATRGIINGQVFGSALVTSPDGYMAIEGLTSYEGTADPYELIYDANKVADTTDRRIVLAGPVNQLGDSQKLRVYAGETYFQPDGIMRGSKKGALANITSTITWNGTPPGGTKTEKYRWTQTDDCVYFRMRLEYVTPGVANSSLIVALPADMPAPVTEAGADEIVAASITGAMGTAANVSPTLSKAFMIGDGAGGWQFDVVLNSGTIAAGFAFITGSYFTS